MNHSSNFIDLTDKMFGRWKVLSITNKKSRRDYYWLCQCSCGLIKNVSGNSLRNGSKSCGCLKKEILSKDRSSIHKKNKSNFNSIKARYKFDAKSRNIEWNLSDEKYFELIQDKCFYCGRNPENKFIQNKVITYYNGIDRVNNLHGYSDKNCVTCCKNCNTKKKSITPEMIKLCYNFLFGEK